MDATYDQIKVHQVHKEWYLLGKEAYSFDLTAATDRLPIILECAVLYRAFGSFPLVLY